MADLTSTCLASSSSSSTSYGHVFDIFLNHRGEKKRLASDMYRRLTVKGLRVFLDVAELEKGEDIFSQIKEAIRTASLHVAIFSPAYAQSRWCLEELALMVESGSTIIPVFIDVDPKELRWTQSGDGPYAQNLQILERKTTLDPDTNEDKPRHDSATLKRWRNALSVVSYKSGFVMDAYNGDEGLLVDAVVEVVWRKVGKTPLHVARYPTGLDEKIQHLERMVPLRRQQTQKPTVVGIVGLGGVGKSTLAREFFNKHRSNYARYCFLSDVRETAAKSSLSSLQAALLKELDPRLKDKQISNTHEGIEMLSEHLSSSQPSLIVLDDVDHVDQLEALLFPVKDSIKSSCLILVTSRNKDLLTSSGIVEESIYKQKGLNQQHSRQLFCSHAFDQTFPNKGFEQLVEDFLTVCDGLPLSLKAIGALIRGKDLECWKAQLRKIHRIVPTDIQSTLKTSYDGLDKEEQEIFLDIACFLIGENKHTAIRIWNESGWEGSLGLRSLENRCLVEVDSKDCIRMHDHLRDLGRDVAEKEHQGRRLRLSRPNGNLSFSAVSSPVRGLNMDYENGSEQFFENVAGNCNLSSLQLLRGQGSFVGSVFSGVELRQLIYLRWEKCPISSISFTNLTWNLRVLYIQGKNLETLWQHESQAPIQLRELHIHAPLSDIPESFGKLNQLEIITLENSVFKTLPNVFHQRHCLKHISLKFCRKMMSLPDSVGILTALQTLELVGCHSLQGLPDSVGQLTGLQSLKLVECSSLQGLPDSVGQLTGLQSLSLLMCSSLQGLPDSVGQLTGLQSLCLCGCSSLQWLPCSVGQLTGLQSLDLCGCSSLMWLPDSMGAANGPPEPRLGGVLRLGEGVGEGVVHAESPRVGGAADGPPEPQLDGVLQPGGTPRLCGAADGPPEARLDGVLQPGEAPRVGGAADGPPEPRLVELLQHGEAPRLGGAADGPPELRLVEVLQPAEAPRLGGAADGPPEPRLAGVLQPAGAPRLGGAADGPPEHQLARVLQPAEAPRLGGAADGPPEPRLAVVLQPAGAPRLGGAADGPPEPRLAVVLQPAGPPRLGGAADWPPEHQLGRLLQAAAAPRLTWELNETQMS